MVKMRAGAVAVVAGFALVASAGAAHAFGVDPTPPPPPENPPSQTSWKPPVTRDEPGPVGPAKTGTVRSCHIVSSASYLGASCGGLGGGGDAKSIKAILGKDELPDCWNERMSDAELAAMNYDNTPGPQGSSFYWKKCLKGIDPKTLKVEPGGVFFTVGWETFRNNPGPSDPKPVELTDNQKKLVAMKATDGQIPYPVAGVSPSTRPRVNQDVAFFDGTADVVTVRAVGVLLRAKVEKITVKPLGADSAESLSCAGKGVVAKAGDTPGSLPGACWYRYTVSSAGEPESMFQVPITAHWVVSTSTDNGATWTRFNSFEKTSTTTVRVNEIQAIVVR
jgi:hypothetical protein